jgi:tripartite-type tricarboxylate transporter receptor subunit TctC
LVVAANAINATLYDKLSFNFIRDIAPVASISREPNVMVTNLSVPAKTVPEFIAYAKTNPGKITMASPGNGTPAHLAGELLKMMTGIEAAHVVYRGTAPLLTDLLSGPSTSALPPGRSNTSWPASCEHWESRAQHVRSGCRTSQPSTNSCRASM